MFSFRARWKFLFGWWLLQTALLALGLWWHSQLYRSFERRDALEADWQVLAEKSDAPAAATACFDERGRLCDCATGLPAPHASAAKWFTCDEESGLPTSRGVLAMNGRQYGGIATRRADGSLEVRYLRADVAPASAIASSRNMQLSLVITLLLVSGLLGLLSYLVVGKAHDHVQRQRTSTESQALSQIETLQRTRDAIILGLAKLAEFRDEDTGAHLERISAFATRLAIELQRHPGVGLAVSRDFVHLIGISAVLHDIGKVAIPDAILLKPGPLTPDERAVMEQHTVIGANCIAQIERRLGNSNFLRMAGEIAESHHERWDGTGYPYGLRGAEIPLAARIVAIVDVYDALSSRRVYKPPLPHEDCLEVIRSEAGRHFDPAIVTAFLELSDEIQELAERYHSQLPVPSPPPAPLPRWSLARENEELVAAGAVDDSQLWSPAHLAN